MPSPDVPIKPGDLLDRKYRVERVLGSGGMGVVVQARHEDLHRRVAIKFMLAEAMSDKESQERFLREARSAVRLQSEHTARVFDTGRLKNDAPYMVMELLEGKDLGALLESTGPLRIEEAVDYILQACEAIAEAHALGMVHRDIKPRNLFLSRRIDGKSVVKVLDFGLAKTIAGTTDRGLTNSAMIMGSPHYMSPEQMRSTRDVDARADVWSLGICLYELLTGIVPFDAEAVPELCALVLREPARPPSALRADIPPGLVAAIMRCLEKDASRRFLTIADLVEALEPFGGAASVGVTARVLHVVATAGAASASTPPAEAASHAVSLRDSKSETRTAAVFDSRARRDPPRTVVLVVAGLLVAGAAAATFGVARALRPRAASAPSAAPSGAFGSSALPSATVPPTTPAMSAAAPADRTPSAAPSSSAPPHTHVPATVSPPRPSRRTPRPPSETPPTPTPAPPSAAAPTSSPPAPIAAPDGHM